MNSVSIWLVGTVVTHVEYLESAMFEYWPWTTYADIFHGFLQYFWANAEIVP